MKIVENAPTIELTTEELHDAIRDYLRKNLSNSYGKVHVISAADYFALTDGTRRSLNTTFLMEKK